MSGTTEVPAGYSMRLAEIIRSVDGSLLGVQLGKVCLEKDIPVADVAEWFSVSRVTVYGWFKGDRLVTNKHAGRVQALIDKLK